MRQRSTGATLVAGLQLVLPVSGRLRLLAVAGLWLNLSAAALGQTTPQAKPQPAPAPAQTQVETSTREALQQYSAALESLDADQVKKIQPAVDAEGLKRAFREMRELRVTIDNVKLLSTEGAIARVSCRVTQVLTPRAGAKQTTAVTRVMRLRKQETLWVIDGFER